MKRIIRYITWHLIDKKRLHKIMKKRKSRLVEPKHPYNYSKELGHPKGLEDLRKLKKRDWRIGKGMGTNPTSFWIKMKWVHVFFTYALL